MKGFCLKPVSQWGPIQKSQGHSADDTKLVTENGRPSMYVYHTMPMVRTLGVGRCFIRLNERKMEIPNVFEFFIFMKRVDSSGKKLSNKSFTRV